MGIFNFRVTSGRASLLNAKAPRTLPIFGTLHPQGAFIALPTFCITATTSRKERSGQASPITCAIAQRLGSCTRGRNEFGRAYNARILGWLRRRRRREGVIFKTATTGRGYGLHSKIGGGDIAGGRQRITRVGCSRRASHFGLGRIFLHMHRQDGRRPFGKESWGGNIQGICGPIPIRGRCAIGVPVMTCCEITGCPRSPTFPQKNALAF